MIVACMEDVLEVDARPYRHDRPVVCMDETNQQWICEVRHKIPAQPGQARALGARIHAQRRGAILPISWNL